MPKAQSCFLPEQSICFHQIVQTFTLKALLFIFLSYVFKVPQGQDMNKLKGEKVF